MKLSLFTLTALLPITACAAHPQQTANQAAPVSKERRAAASDEDAELLEQVRVFSVDVGELGREAWRELEAYPRQELIARLSRIEEYTADQSARADIAFVFCHLGHEYAASRDFIVSEFRHSLEERSGPAEHYEGLIDRLLKRGDRGLLKVLFEAAPHSDGALSEGLAETFADEMRGNPEQFLTGLKSQPREVRQEVYELLGHGLWDKEKVLGALRAVPKGSPVAGVAGEMARELAKAKDEN